MKKVVPAYPGLNVVNPQNGCVFTLTHTFYGAVSRGRLWAGTYEGGNAAFTSEHYHIRSALSGAAIRWF